MVTYHMSKEWTHALVSNTKMNTHVHMGIGSWSDSQIAQRNFEIAHIAKMRGTKLYK